MKIGLAKIIGWILTFLLGALFIVSAVAKLVGAAQAVDMLTKWGFGDKIMLLGSGELVSAFHHPAHILSRRLVAQRIPGRGHRQPYAARRVIRRTVHPFVSALGRRVPASALDV